VTALFANPNNLLRPGLFATITGPVQQINGAFLVPQKALVEMQGTFFLSFLEQDNTVKSVPVSLGPILGQWQVVSGPIAKGAKVIVEGVEKVRPGMKVVASDWPAPPPPDAAPAPEPSPAPAEAKTQG
jgi:membrane fusion protein (multidrug efflux system)